MKSSGASSAPVPAAPAPAAPRAAAGVPGVKMGEAAVKQEGMRWLVEYHTKDSSKGQIIKVESAGLRDEVYVYGCK